MLCARKEPTNQTVCRPSEGSQVTGRHFSFPSLTAEHGNGKTDRPASKEVVRIRATVKNAGQALNHNDKEEEVSVAEYQFPVDASQIMLFSRAVGDKNPIYHDADYAN